MLYDESSLLPISALQHLIFCERQCALIHIEQAWAENRWTAEGRVMHERVHEGESEWRDNIRIVRGLRLRCLSLGLAGIADMVEFHGAFRNGGDKGNPFPVEYKRGKPKKNLSDKIQLCAQAICLEEMLDCAIPEGALYYGKSRRRLEVPFDNALRAETETAAQRLHELVEAGETPPPVYEKKKCEACSLIDLCMPRTVGRARGVEAYLAEMLKED